ncbi:MAG: alpha/beta hydrolase [Actinomycetota bacterium]
MVTAAVFPSVPLWKELRAPAELGLFVGLAPLLVAATSSPSRTVLVIPGFGTDDRATLPLRTLLGRLGHEVHGWEQGRNAGPTPGRIDGLAAKLQSLAEETGAPVPIVGWSLGGVYGRVMAQWYPDLVDQVISLGSPFNMAADQRTLVSDFYAKGERTGRFVRRRGEIDLDNVPCPSTAVFTRTDGIVPWTACVQSDGPTAENVEVWGSHCGLGSNLSVAHLIADRLRQRRGHWQPFHPGLPARYLYPSATCAN